MNNYVVCLKWGTKYSSEYVNKLYRMVNRNLTLPYEFVCFTENTKGIDTNIRTEPLPSIPVKGWWYKPIFFDPNFILNGTILFLDLDLIVFRNINDLFLYNPGQFCIIRDFNRCSIKNYNNINSSVFRLNTGSDSYVYTNFIKDINFATTRYRGDQEWMFSQMKKNYTYWPDEWIQSYKWEMRGKPPMIRDTKGKRNFSSVAEPTVLNDTRIAVFHGEPNPEDCKDQWVLDNWR